MDFGSGLQDSPFRGRRYKSVAEQDFDTALPQDFVRKSRQRLRHFRQNAVARLNNHAAMRLVAKAKVVLLDSMDTIVQLGHHFDTGQAAAADHKRQQLSA